LPSPDSSRTRTTRAASIATQPFYEAHETNAIRTAERLSAIGGFHFTPPGRLLFGFPGISTDELGHQPLRLARALAQHYLHNTSFVDVTLDPAVAVFFATHRYKNGTY
jgi:hypothetical protein